MQPVTDRDHAPPPIDPTLLGIAVADILAACERHGADLMLQVVHDGTGAFLYYEASVDDGVTVDEYGMSRDSRGAALLDLAAKLTQKPAA